LRLYIILLSLLSRGSSLFFLPPARFLLRFSRLGIVPIFLLASLSVLTYPPLSLVFLIRFLYIDFLAGVSPFLPFLSISTCLRIRMCPVSSSLHLAVQNCLRGGHGFSQVGLLVHSILLFLHRWLQHRPGFPFYLSEAVKSMLSAIMISHERAPE